MEEQKLSIIARILAKEGKREWVKSELVKLIEPTRAEEGCINYDLHQDHENPNFFVFYENWKNEELLKKHLASAHMAAYLKATEGTVDEFVVHKMRQL